MRAATKSLPPRSRFEKPWNGFAPANSSRGLSSIERGVIGVINLSTLEKEPAEGADKKLV